MPFLPQHLSLLYCLAATNIFLLIGGYIIVKNSWLLAGWTLFIATIVFTERISINENPVFRMLAIISSMFICMKIISASESYKKSKFNLSVVQWAAFSLGWAGMRPQIFETLGQKRIEGATRLLWYGFSRLFIGVILLLLSTRLAIGINNGVIFYIVTVLLLVSYSLILHFGILSISAGIWRLMGVKAYLLFKSPLQSVTLSEFWSKRWNIAFSEMTSIAVYRPLKNKLAPAAIVTISFIFSGFLHEMAISLPVRTGFGLPLLYFIIQGAAIVFENFFNKKPASFLTNKFIAKVWVYGWVIVPAPLLFHIHFIKEIVWSIAGLQTK